MRRKYYLHRISHESNVSYSLLDKGYLSLGWRRFADTDIIQAVRDNDKNRFNEIAREFNEERNRSRMCIWHFSKINVGDLIVVPLYGGKFSIYEALDIVRPIFDLSSCESSILGKWNSHEIIWKDNSLYDQIEERTIDLGFYIKVQPVSPALCSIPRKHADGILVSRMKMRQTNGEISDIKEHIEAVISGGGAPISLYDKSIDNLCAQMRENIYQTLDDDRFERLVKWYLKRCGASIVRRPARNEQGKEDGADADVIAEFENLKHVIYVQAKKHKKITSEWAVNQISKYKEQKYDGDSGYSYSIWVISSAEGFSDEAYALAEDNNVRLINGFEFAKMLFDIGLLNMDEFD